MSNKISTVPPAILTAFETGLKDLIEKGRYNPKNIKIERTKASSRIAAEKGERFCNVNRSAIIEALNHVEQAVETQGAK